MATLDFHQVTKNYGTVRAVDDLEVEVGAGRITAFLGANGSGKTTTMRILLGLSDPDAGTATINGIPYRSLQHPMQVVGAVLDPGFHPRRSARDHLRLTARQAVRPRNPPETNGADSAQSGSCSSSSSPTR